MDAQIVNQTQKTLTNYICIRISTLSDRSYPIFLYATIWQMPKGQLHMLGFAFLFHLKAEQSNKFFTLLALFGWISISFTKELNNYSRKFQHNIFNRSIRILHTDYWAADSSTLKKQKKLNYSTTYNILLE